MKKILVVIALLALVLFGYRYYKVKEVIDAVERGDKSLKLNEYETAIENYNFVILKNERSFMVRQEKVAYAYGQRGFAYHGLTEFDTALNDYNKAEELGLNNAGLFCNRGLVKIKLDKFDEAILDFKRSIELDPKDALSYWGLGWSQIYLKEYDEAIINFEKSIELDPKYANSYLALGQAYSRGYKNYEKAKEYFDKAVELKYEYNFTYYLRGNANKELGNLKEAEIDFQKAIDIKPIEDAEGYNFRGLAYYNLEDYEAAVSDFEKAIEINPNYKYSYESLGDAYKELKQNEMAAEYYNKYLSLIDDEEDEVEVKEKLKEMGYESE